jgi:hypothetical protein
LILSISSYGAKSSTFARAPTTTILITHGSLAATSLTVMVLETSPVT